MRLEDLVYPETSPSKKQKTKRRFHFSRKELAVIAVATAALLIFVAYGLPEIMHTISNSGSINTPASLSAPSSIDWGTLDLGQTKTEQVIFQNTGESDIAALNMTSTIDPSLGELTWSDEGLGLPGGETRTVSFTLAVSATAPTGAFAFDITISG